MPRRWHAMTNKEVIEHFKTDAQSGLSDKKVGERAARFGPNELAKAPKPPLWQLFINQFKDFMVLVLLAATAISGFLGEYADAVTIMIIVIINAVLGFIQE